MESLAAHEFTQPLLPCPLVPAAGSDVGIQLGDAQVERLRKCRSWARGSPFRRETKKLGLTESCLPENGQLKAGGETTSQMYLVGLLTFYWPSPLLELKLSWKRPCHPYSLPGM